MHLFTIHVGQQQPSTLTRKVRKQTDQNNNIIFYPIALMIIPCKFIPDFGKLSIQFASGCMRASNGPQLIAMKKLIPSATLGLSGFQIEYE